MLEITGILNSGVQGGFPICQNVDILAERNSQQYVSRCEHGTAHLLWVGFILAISFMEAPLKFRVQSLTLPVTLEIGHLVFHALNGIEIGLALVILAITLLAKWSR